MLIPLDDDTYVHADAVTMVRRHDVHADDDATFTIDIRGHKAPALIDGHDLARLIRASAPVVPGGGWSLLSHRFDIWGLPIVTANPVIAWRILSKGAEPVTVTPLLRGKAEALLSPHGMVHVIATGEVVNHETWGHRLILEKAQRDGRVLDAPASVTDDQLRA